MEVYATDAEVVGWVVLLVIAIVWLCVQAWRHRADYGEMGTDWMARHIDSNGKYRP